MGALRIRVAHGFRQRLRGVRAWPGWGGDPLWGLLIPRCCAVHTLMLDAPLDLVFLARDGRVLRSVKGLPPNRFARHPGAWAVLELPGAQDFVAGVSVVPADGWPGWKIVV